MAIHHFENAGPSGGQEQGSSRLCVYGELTSKKLLIILQNNGMYSLGTEAAHSEEYTDCLEIPTGISHASLKLSRRECTVC